MEAIGVSVEVVLDWFPRASESFVDALYAWAEDVDSTYRVTSDDFARWWRRFERFAGGEMPASMQTDIKVLFGEVALRFDIDNSTTGDDDAGVGATACREALVEAGMGPGGMWRVWLLSDRMENAFTVAQQWEGHDPNEAAVALRSALGGILDESDDVARTSLSARAKRVATAIGAVCSLHLETAEQTRQRVERFFDLAVQYRHEAGEVDPEIELTYIALAGVIAYANLGDLAGVEQVMRRVRHRAADSDGKLPPRFMSIWASGLKSLDPRFAQMIARQLLMDTTRVNTSERRSDAQFAAAFLLMETSVLAGDQELADELANEWIPLAIESPHGPGSQRWVNAVEESTDDNEGGDSR
jgi:hypothetical protein